MIQQFPVWKLKIISLFSGSPRKCRLKDRGEKDHSHCRHFVAGDFLAAYTKDKRNVESRILLHVFFSRVLVRMWFLFTLRAWFSNSHLNLTVFCELLLTLHLIPWTNRILSLFLPSCSFLVPYSSRSTPSSSSSSSSFFLLHFLVLIYFSFSLPSLNPPLFTPYLFFFFFQP